METISPLEDIKAVFHLPSLSPSHFPIYHSLHIPLLHALTTCLLNHLLDYMMKGFLIFITLALASLVAAAPMITDDIAKRAENE